MANIAQLERAWNSILDKFEAVLRLRLIKHFNGLINTLKKQLDDNTAVGGALILLNADRDLEEIFNDVLPAVATAGALFTLNDLQPKDEQNDSIAGEVTASLILWMLINSKERAQLINRTTIKIFIRVTETLSAIPELTGPTLNTAILADVKKRNTARINVISATEAHNSASRGQIQAGIIINQRVDKTWISQRDRVVRPTHIRADGQRVPIDQPFRVGSALMMRPSDPAGGPAETIGCRCFLRLRRQD